MRGAPPAPRRTPRRRLHLTRQIPGTIEHGGFTVEQFDCYYIKGEPKPFSYTFEGHAVRA